MIVKDIKYVISNTVTGREWFDICDLHRFTDTLMFVLLKESHIHMWKRWWATIWQLYYRYYYFDFSLLLKLQNLYFSPFLQGNCSDAILANAVEVLDLLLGIQSYLW